MPAAVLLAAASTIGGVAAAGGLAAFSFFGVTGLTGALLAGVTSLAFSTLTGALQKKPKAGAFDFGQQASGRTSQVRQPITTHKLLLGEILTSGAMTFYAQTSNKKYHHYIITLSRHEVDDIGEIWVGDEVVPADAINANGDITSGRFAGKLRLRKHLGHPDQTADEKLVAEVSEWTTAHRGRNTAYIYVRVQYERDTFPTGLPNISAIVRGKKLFDPRTSETKWSPNIALMGRYYLTDDTYGLESDDSDINDDAIIAAANICEEIVDTKEKNFACTAVATNAFTLTGEMLEMTRGTRVRLLSTGVLPTGLATGTDYFIIPKQFGKVPRVSFALTLDDALEGNAVTITGSGTGTHTVRKTGEPRYFGGGVIDTAATLGDNLRDMLSGMGGAVTNTGGYWEFHAAAYRVPSIRLDDSHLRSPATISPRRSRKDKYNSVKGIYVSPLNFWQPQDYPEISVPAYIEKDRGRKINSDLDLPFTQSSTTAQRLARIKIEQNRREITCTYPVNLHGMPLKAVDTVMISNDRRGWDDKVFEVTLHHLIEDTGTGGGPVLGVDLNLQETDANVYDWDTDLEGEPNPAARTNLSSVWHVTPPIGLAVNSIRLSTLESDSTFRVVLSWEEHEDAFVRQGGWYQIKYKKSESDTWLTVNGRVEGDETTSDVFSGELGTLYDIQMRAFNRIGAPSVYNTLSGFVVGTAGGVTETLDWGNLSPHTTAEDWGDFSAPTLFDDYGGFTG